jgi:hypothetical protein
MNKNIGEKHFEPFFYNKEFLTYECQSLGFKILVFVNLSWLLMKYNSNFAEDFENPADSVGEKTSG